MATGAASQSKPPSKSAMTRLAMGVMRRVWIDTSPFCTPEAPNLSGKL